ncbi:MAG TPA: GWxTD domain-containing protein [Longimicrobiales bacterium]|nr:GWxTD domain-containing protein [Longimicrobiales bacterium]
MSRILLAASLALALQLLPADGVAQEPKAVPSRLQAGIDAAARGDTVQALAILDDLLEADPRLAEAHFQRAKIYASLASGRATQFQERALAESALEQAIKQDPRNPLYLLAMGKLMLMQQVRVDARRIFQRALTEAARADAATLAEVHYQLGLFHETQWVRFKDRHMLPMGRDQFDTDMAFYDARWAWNFLTDSPYPGSDQGDAERSSMLDHYRAALSVHPSHRGASTHLMAYLHDEGLYEQLLDVAHAFVGAAQSDPLAYLGLGLGHYRKGSMEEAAGAFHYALTLMSTEERRQFEGIGRILSKDGEARYTGLSPDQRLEYERRFWSVSDPLMLTAANEFWLEYMARMAYVDFRFGIEEYKLRGWQTDRGDIYLRYGPPVKRAAFGAAAIRTADMSALGKVTTGWSYGPDGPGFGFRQNPGFRNARFADDFAFYSEDFRSVQPARFESPTLPERLPLPVQVVRFRGPEGRMDVEVHAALPMAALGEGVPVAESTVERGVFVQDQQAREVERIVGEEIVRFREADGRRVESWRLSLQPDGRYIVGVEAREPLTWRAAVGRATVDPKLFALGELSISDILLADVVQPLDTLPASRTDFRIVPNPEMVFRPDQGVNLYFELYNLLPDDDQFASYEVELAITVEEIEREGPGVLQALAELADKWGFTKEGTSPAELRFQKQQRVVAQDILPEYFNVQLPGAPRGRYGLSLTVRDQNAGTEATTTRTFHIRPAGDGEGS